MKSKKVVGGKLVSREIINKLYEIGYSETELKLNFRDSHRFGVDVKDFIIDGLVRYIKSVSIEYSEIFEGI